MEESFRYVSASCNPSPGRMDAWAAGTSKQPGPGLGAGVQAMVVNGVSYRSLFFGW